MLGRHIALEVEEPVLTDMRTRGKAAGIVSAGTVDHGFIHSNYFRDPNGYVIELTAKAKGHAEATDPTVTHAREAGALDLAPPATPWDSGTATPTLSR